MKRSVTFGSASSVFSGIVCVPLLILVPVPPMGPVRADSICAWTTLLTLPAGRFSSSATQTSTTM